jgi:hypothetical protein
VTVRPVVLILALACGVFASLLVGCGSKDTAKLIAATDSDALVKHLEDVQNAVDLGKCNLARTALGQLNADLSDLPKSVDADLRSELRDGYKKLSARAVTECGEVAKQHTTVTTAATTAESVPETVASTEETTPATTEETTATEPTTNTQDNGGVPPEPTTTDDTTTPPPGVTAPTDGGFGP